MQKILEEHKLHINQMIDISLVYLTNRTFDFNSGFIERMVSDTGDRVYGIWAAKNETQQDPQRIQEAEDALDKHLTQLCFLYGSVAGAESLRIIGFVFRGIVQVIWGNVLIPLTNWQPDTNYFIDIGRWEERDDDRNLRLAAAIAQDGLDAITVDGMNEGYRGITSYDWFIPDDMIPLLMESVRRIEPVIALYNNTITEVYKQVFDIVAALNRENDGWKNRLNRETVPILNEFDSWDILPRIRNIRNSMDNFKAKFHMNSTFTEQFDKVYWEMKGSKLWLNLYWEIEKFLKEKQFVDSAAAIVRSTFREHIEVNEPQHFPKLPKLTQTMAQEVALFKLTLAKELFALELFPFAHNYFPRLPNVVGNIGFVDRTEASATRENTMDVITGFSDQVLQSSVNSQWQRSGRKDFFTWKYEEHRRKIREYGNSWDFAVKPRFTIDVNASPSSMEVIVAQDVYFELRPRNASLRDKLDDILSHRTLHIRHSGYSTFIADKRKYLIMHAQWITEYSGGNNRNSASRNAEDVLLSPFTTWELWNTWDGDSHNSGQLQQFLRFNPTDIVLTMEWKYLRPDLDWSGIKVGDYYQEDIF